MFDKKGLRALTVPRLPKNRNEFGEFLDGMDIVEAGYCARDLRKRYNTEIFGAGTEGSFAVQAVKMGSSFYTGHEAQSTAPFTVRCPSEMYFCAVPVATSKKRAKANWYQISRAQYQYGLYLLGIQKNTVVEQSNIDKR